MRNKVISLLDKFDKEKIEYSLTNLSKKDIVNAKKIKIPHGLNEMGYLKENKYPKGGLEKINIVLPKKQTKNMIRILKKENFKFGYGNSNLLSYFYYDQFLGLINIQISYNKKFFSNKKINKFSKKLFIFVSPEGGGKTTLLSATNTLLKKYPIKIENIHFGSFRTSKFYRIFDLGKKILKIKKNKFLGKVTLTDRYIYLTFNQIPFLRKIIRFIAPKPNVVFVIKTDYKTHKKRRGILCPPKEKIERIYSIYSLLPNKLIINSSKKLERNIGIIINKILNELENKNEEKEYLRKII